MRVQPADGSGNSYERVMGHRPEILEQWFRLDSTMRFGGVLDPALKEEVRRSLASGVGCVFCSSFGDAGEGPPDARVSLAVTFADLVFKNFTRLEELDDSLFDVLAEEFTVEEIVELVAWTCFILGAQAFGALMRLPAATPDEIVAYADWRSAGEAAALAAGR